MKQLELKNMGLEVLDQEELQKVEGGLLLPFLVAGAFLGYYFAKMIADKNSEEG